MQFTVTYSVSYHGKKIKYKALSKPQTVKTKLIALFHAFIFYTYGTKHSVVCFLLLIWKMLGKGSM